MKRGSIFELDGVPRLREACPLALQHVVAMIVGCVTPAIIVAGAAAGGLNSEDRVILIQASLLMSGLATLLQLFPIGKEGNLQLAQASHDHGSKLCLCSKYAGYCRRIWGCYDFWSTDRRWYRGPYYGTSGKKDPCFFPPLITGTVVFTIVCLCILRPLTIWQGE